MKKQVKNSEKRKEASHIFKGARLVAERDYYSFFIC